MCAREVIVSVYSNIFTNSAQCMQGLILEYVISNKVHINAPESSHTFFCIYQILDRRQVCQLNKI